MEKRRILWADDEIELLQPHVMFLQEKGYEVTQATNADDAIKLAKEGNFDLVLLDEMMPGKDGLTTLNEIKDFSPNLPVIMITKNEEEFLMEEAIGNKIDDYLTKPVNPSQILSACKKILEKRKITGEKISRDYVSEFSKISLAMMNPLTANDWVDINLKLFEWELELDKHKDLGLLETLMNQRRECNIEFGKFIEKNYLSWVQTRKNSPTLSVDIVSKYIYPEVKSGKNVFFFVIDCMRLDQWIVMENLLYEFFNITREHYYAILPTATPYSRNAIFSGLFPIEIEKQFPDLWSKGDDDDSSRNRNERQLLDAQLSRLKLNLKPEPKYIKIIDTEEARNTERKIASFLNIPLVSIVVNFIDILTHSRSDSSVLKEIAPDESAFRSLTLSWFEHSWLFQIFKFLSKQDVTIFITTDHGSIKGLRGSKVIGDKETSTNLRYKYGSNLKCDSKEAIFIKNPADYKLPTHGIITNYIIAKEDYYFVYPTNYHYYLSYYKDSFQHGGASLEEMIVPIVKMTTKQ
jgi:DNA-binding response OmpR family regulator